jgi:diaminohydroxyphosphoribosylaminopyrimidine deaminase/5-amino-6-(5-phosphoribosylamino)uracil reductase
VNETDAMRLALDLARLGEGDVNPNPLVGAVVLRDGVVVGRGYHQRFGGPHAEVFALEEAGERARGATLVVTLEPCCHHGKTPPCTERIIEAGVRRVVYATADPNPLVSGRGAAHLREAGIDVDEGLLASEAREQNEIFARFVTTGRPFVQLKLAASLDGRIATRTGDSRWITGELSRTEAHRLRRRFSSVLVGVRTVLADDPELTVRHVPGRSPIPIVLDPSGRVPTSARLFSAHESPIVATCSIPREKEEALRSRGARVWHLCESARRLDLAQLLERLGAEGVDSVLVEGGGETAAAFLEAGLVDKVTTFLAPILIGGRDAVPAIGGVGADVIAHALRLERVTVRRFGDDLCITGYPPSTP